MTDFLFLQLPVGKIRDSNRVMLIAAVREAHADPIDMGIVADIADGLKAALLQAISEADVVVTSGGVSMGSLDMMKPLLESIGVVHFGRLLMKPGKPTTFATVPTASGQCPVFALPGNPCSTMSTFQLLVLPALRAMQQLPSLAGPQVECQLLNQLKLDVERPEYVRATVWFDNAQRQLVARSTGSQMSSRLLSFRGANALLHIPQGPGTLQMGSTVVATLTDHVAPSPDCTAPSVQPLDVMVVATPAAAHVSEALKELLRQGYPLGLPPCLAQVKLVSEVQRECLESLLANNHIQVVLVVDNPVCGHSGLEEVVEQRASGLEEILGQSVPIDSTSALWGPIAGVYHQTVVLSVPPSLKGARAVMQAAGPALHSIVQSATGKILTTTNIDIVL